LKPYIDTEIKDSYVIREFSVDLDSEELKWHRDYEDRIVESIGKTDWKIQLENQLPITINNKVFIPKGVWHRAIKGSDNLKVKITKL
jgi:hypothetical protein